jgi:hypothetical protein
MSNYCKFAGLFAIGMLFSVGSLAQSIRGTVTDSLGKPVPYANVNLRNRGNLIIAYAISNNNGGYVLGVPAAAAKDTLLVEISCMGFKKQSKAISDFSAPVNFVLLPAMNQLKEVLVKDNRPRLRTNGDTIGYKVSDFSNPQDRVIGDVIKRLPGIAVATDGTISYNGKNISNLYIGGDNLLDDKYNIATNTIPHGVVDQVQVIQNDQPIKMLRNKVVSDDVALNLTIKKGAKLQLVGQETVGAGLPGNYYVDLNAMMFKDAYKAINYLKGNNTGYDLQQDLVAHNAADYQQLLGNNLPQPLLSLGTINNPDLARNRYLFNQTGVLNVNNLINLKHDWQLRVNAYYLHDRQKQDYSQQNSTFLPSDTVRYNEAQHNRIDQDLLHAQFNLRHNADKNYLNNVLQFDDNRLTGYSDLNTNGDLLKQKLTDHLQSFSNEFNLIKSDRSNHIIQAYSYISHQAEPESLNIAPDYNAAQFNNGIPYAQLIQNVNVPTWYTNNYLSYKIPGALGTQSFRAGFSLQSQSLNSGLLTQQTDHSIQTQSDSAVNRLNWDKRRVYAEAAYDLPGDKLKANVALPLILQQISYADTGYALRRELTRLYFNPHLQLKYYTSVENFLTVLYNYRNQAGTIEDIYQGEILKNYRTLYTNSADLTLQQNHLAAIGFNYRKALTLFFWSLNASYNHVSTNNIASMVITDSLQRREMLPYPNSTDAWTINGNISKYSFALTTTFSAGLQWQSARSVQIQNNVLLPFNTTAEMVNLGADTKVNDQINFSYKANFTQTDSHSDVATSAYHINQLLQQASVNYNPAEFLQFKLAGEHYFTRQQGNPDLKYFFTDASAKFRFEKWKVDLELDANNFLNVKTYSALNLSANTLTSSSYTLPGRIILLKVLFNL